MIKNRTELAEYFASLGFTKGAEVGVADGRYSEILCEKIPDLELVAVDPFYRGGHYEKAKSRLEKYNVNIIRTTSMEALFGLSDSGEQIKDLDFVFIDGDHRFNFVMEDIIGWTRRVRKGGIVSGHDYYHFNNSGVIEAVNKYTEMNKIQLNLIPRSEGGHIDDKAPCWWFMNK